MNSPSDLEGVGSRAAKYDEQLDYIDQIQRYALKKFGKRTASDVKRLSWGRLLVSASMAFAKVMEAAKMEELEARIELLERQRGTGP